MENEWNVVLLVGSFILACICLLAIMGRFNPNKGYHYGGCVEDPDETREWEWAMKAHMDAEAEELIQQRKKESNVEVWKTWNEIQRGTESETRIW